jgi:hypothetical protein
MRSTQRIAISAVLVAVTAAGSIAAIESPAASYAIRIERPAVVGRKLHVVGSVKSRQRTLETVADTALSPVEVSFDLDFVGDLEVLAVSPRGRATEESVAVERCTRTENGLGRQVVPRGLLVHARLVDGRTVFESGTGTLSAAGRAALALVVELSADDEPSDDQALGAAPPKTIGEAWAVEPRTMSAVLARAGMRVAARDVAGETKLIGLRTLGGVRGLEVRAEITAHDVVLDTALLPAGVRPRGGMLTGRFAYMLPLDPALPPIEERADFESDSFLSGTVENRPVRMSLESRLSKDLRLALVP